MGMPMTAMPQFDPSTDPSNVALRSKVAFCAIADVALSRPGYFREKQGDFLQRCREYAASLRVNYDLSLGGNIIPLEGRTTMLDVTVFKAAFPHENRHAVLGSLDKMIEDNARGADPSDPYNFFTRMGDAYQGFTAPR